MNFIHDSLLKTDDEDYSSLWVVVFLNPNNSNFRTQCQGKLDAIRTAKAVAEQLNSAAYIYDDEDFILYVANVPEIGPDPHFTVERS